MEIQIIMYKKNVITRFLETIKSRVSFFTLEVFISSQTQSSPENTSSQLSRTLIR
jgi:hypothetical protein